jgi:hypothetical protein
VRIIATRKTEKRRVEQFLLTHDRVIKQSDWSGKYIPIVTSIGGCVNIDGKKHLMSLIRWAKDPAKMYNYSVSAQVEVLAFQPKAPFIVADGQVQGFEDRWNRANLENLPYLEYNPVDGAPPPQRQMPAPMPQGLSESRMAAAEDIKATLGMYDASLGARSNETSGVAIKARQQEGDTGTFHFVDNHARAIEQCGRILIDLLPHVYDTPRVVRIVSPSDEETMVLINQTFADPHTGQEQLHDLQLGRYEVSVRVGPSFESRRQEMVQAMVEISAANPQIMQIAGDLVLKNMDWPQAKEIGERMAKMLPPQITGAKPPPDPAQQLAQAQVQTETIKAQSAQAKAHADAQGKAAESQLAQQEMQLKMAELQAEAQKLQLETQLAREQMALEREKLNLEYAKLRNAMQSEMLGAMQPEPEEVAPNSLS